MTTSCGVTMPRSPCAASGCTKKEEVPVLAKVAAILRPMAGLAHPHYHDFTGTVNIFSQARLKS